MTRAYWHRGLLRLWAFLAAAWIVCVLSFVWLTGDLEQNRKELGRAKAWENMILRIEDGIKSGGLKANNGAFVVADQLRTDLVGIKERQPEIVEQSKKAKNWFLSLLAFLFIPTVGLFLVGRAGIWVVEGFYAKQGH